MIGIVIISKIKLSLLFFINLFRRALCCFRQRRRLSYIEPLTGIGIGASERTELAVDNWHNWDKDFVRRQPATVQEHIEFYREQKAGLQTEEETVKEQASFFEDMIPEITKQKKVFVNTDIKNAEQSNCSSLTFHMMLMGNDLGEWVEDSGWDGEKLDWEVMDVLKEKKRNEREKRALEQQQRRAERSTKSITANVRINP